METVHAASMASALEEFAWSPVGKDERPFQPHITIASRDLKKGDFAAAWAYFSGRSYEARFEADTVSLLRNAGSQWEIAGEYPFGDMS